jgi:hypothetical protein
MTTEFATAVATILPVISLAIVGLLALLTGAPKMWQKPSNARGYIGVGVLWLVAAAYFVSLVFQVKAEIDCLHCLLALPLPDGTKTPPSADFAYTVTIVSLIMMLILPTVVLLARAGLGALGWAISHVGRRQAN